MRKRHAGRMAMAWYDHVFNELYDEFTFHFFSEKTNELEADFIHSTLDLKAGNKVLDIACGFGRLAIPLAEKGIDVVGIDITRRYIDKANRKKGDLKASFTVGDMRAIVFEGEFDAAFSFFTSFGYFDDETNFDVLQRISNSLKPGAKFLLDTQNRELFSTGETDYEEFTEFTHKGRDGVLLMTSKLDLATGRVAINQRIFHPPEEPLAMFFEIRLFTLSELRWLLSCAGMKFIAAYGSANAEHYNMTSPRCIIVAEKL